MKEAQLQTLVEYGRFLGKVEKSLVSGFSTSSWKPVSIVFINAITILLCLRHVAALFLSDAASPLMYLLSECTDVVPTNFRIVAKKKCKCTAILSFVFAYYICEYCAQICCCRMTPAVRAAMCCTVMLAIE
jgi:hypothetical protein